MYDASLTTQLPRYAWAAIAVVWGIAACFAKKTVRAESRGRRMVELTLLMIAFSLLFNAAFRPGLLGLRVLPASGIVPWIGVAATFAGIGFSIWARFYLGRNWSAAVVVRKDHELIMRGPYGLMRHPIYSAILLMFVGTVLAVGTIEALAGLLLIVASLWIKLRREEQLMIRQFPDEYPAYRRRVKRLIPYIW